MRRWIVVGVSLPLVAVGIMVGVGALLPEAHTASVTRVVAGTPEEVWAVITDVEAFPEWRPDVDQVSLETAEDGALAWVESGSSGSIPMRVERREAPRLLVARIGEGLPFGGTWSYRLEPASGGTRVTLTEDGEVYNPFYRFVSRFVLGYRGTMERYLDALEARMDPGRSGSR